MQCLVADCSNMQHGAGLKRRTVVGGINNMPIACLLDHVEVDNHNKLHFKLSDWSTLWAMITAREGLTECSRLEHNAVTSTALAHLPQGGAGDGGGADKAS